MIFLRWSDASYQTECVLYRHDLKPEMMITTGGLLIQETATHYSVALDHYPGQETWRQVAHIPKVNVRQVVKFPWPETDHGAAPPRALRSQIKYPRDGHES